MLFLIIVIVILREVKRQTMYYNVTLKGVLATILAVEKQ
jgi:hypothetical protein